MNQKKKSLVLLAIIYLAFISLGLPDGVLGVAWPTMRVGFGMPLERVAILTTLLLIVSALSSFFSGRILHRLGTGGVTLLSGAITGLGLLGFAFSPSFVWLLVFTIPLGLGQGAVDSGLNLYVAEHYSASQMNWLHCFWGAGASIGPLVMARALTGGGWRTGYGVLSAIQLSLSVVLLISVVGGLWRIDRAAEQTLTRGESEPIGALHAVSDQLLAVMLFFLYTGIEFSVGVWLNSVLIESRHLSVGLAGGAVSLYYVAIMGGRLLSGFAVGRLGNRSMINLGLCLAGMGCLLLIFSGGNVPAIFLGVIILGGGQAPVYPCLIHETPRRFAPAVTRRLIGYQVGSACLGGSLVSACAGILLARFSLELLFPLLLILLVISFVGNEVLARRAKSFS